MNNSNTTEETPVNLGDLINLFYQITFRAVQRSGTRERGCCCHHQ